jgi:hypothetical protein
MRGGERLNGGETCRQYTIGHRVVHAGKVDRPYPRPGRLAITLMWETRWCTSVFNRAFFE